MADVHGSDNEVLTAMPAVLVGLLDDGVAGGSDAVFADGEPVVDVWAGVADAGRTIPPQRETIANVSSVTRR